MEETPVDKTKVDEMMIHMIQPRLEEIETRFSNGEGLSGDDINTLLLKSQFNHINHLDLRLDEVTADVAHLKMEFIRLETKVDSRFDVFEARMDGFEKNIKAQISDMRLEMKEEVSGIKEEVSQIRVEISQMKVEVAEAINKNMRWGIGLIVVLAGLLKLADILVK